MAKFVKLEEVSLKNHPELNEKWVQEVIASNPEILGLGNLQLKDKERIQPHAGRLDLLLQSDDDSNTRYEVEIQLGKTDESQFHEMKRHGLFFILCFAFVACLQAQSVSYTYKPFSAEGCMVSYTPVFVGDTAYIVVSVQSDRLVFSDNPTMMVRFFNTDQILLLSGKKMDAISSSGAVMVGNVFVPYTETKAMAMFRVTEQRMEFFKLGVERVRLSTLPITHDRTFNYDKIGVQLYQNYLSVKKKAQDF